jgi:hypothetical protein
MVTGYCKRPSCNSMGSDHREKDIINRRPNEGRHGVSLTYTPLFCATKPKWGDVMK